MNSILIVSLLFLGTHGSVGRPASTNGLETVWHGGHPTEPRKGSCFCGSDERYCKCTPNLAIDLLIISGKNKEYVWLVRRKDNGLLATMGGFVDVDETLEAAVKREVKEEMDIDLTKPPKLFGFYNDPRRDNRRRTSSAVFTVYLDDDLNPRAGDDAKGVERILLDDIEKHSYFCDHRSILMDYKRFVRGEPPQESSAGDFAPDIDRHTCAYK